MSTELWWCRRCGSGHQLVGDIPVVCPDCHRPTSWTMMPPSEPRIPYVLTVNDRELLRRYCIASEER